MAKITFIILAHENAEHTADLAKLLTDWDKSAHAVIHYDEKSPMEEFSKLKAQFQGSDKVYLVDDRIRCGWGDFSLVDATMRALKVIRREKIQCDRVMLVSGACMPIRPLKEMSQFLDRHPTTEFIEAFDSGWITGGLRQERYQYWHLFNFQRHYKLFNAHYNFQRKIGLKRRFPRGLEPRFGSQWWCLTWDLCEKILNYARKHPLQYFFFSTTWIPDELFFQTLAFKFTPASNLASRNLTFFHFNEWGKPLVLLDDHIGLLDAVPYFFARKISNRAPQLRAKLKAIALKPAPENSAEIDWRTRYALPFKQLLLEKWPASGSTPGLFQPKPKAGWEEMLRNCSRSFAILFGPPQLTRRAADSLRGTPGLDVFGRLFKRTEVDLGPATTTFRGLHRNDQAIRDYDMPGYFRRLLSRCEQLPVFELCPGDDPSAEMALLQSRNSIVLPIVAGTESEVMDKLYWILCAEPRSGEPAFQAGKANPAETPVTVFKSMLDSVETRISRDYKDRTETFLRTAMATETTSPEHWAYTLAFQHGEGVLPLTSSYDKLAKAVECTKLEDATSHMPASWRDSFRMLAPLDPRWQIVRLNFPVILSDLRITATQLQALALSKSGKNVASIPATTNHRAG